MHQKNSILFIGIATLFLLPAVQSCTTTNQVAAIPLKVLDILGDAHISPKGGIEYKNALDFMKSNIIPQMHIRTDSQNSYKFEEVTTQEIWENNRMQLFRCQIPSAEVDGIMIYRNARYFCFIVNLKIIAVFAADLDNNGKYDVCLNSIIRSGMERQGENQIHSPWVLLFHESNKPMAHTIVSMCEPGHQINLVVSIDLREKSKDIVIQLNKELNRIDAYVKNVDEGIDALRFIKPLSYSTTDFYMLK